jgi:hypothetical protein
MTVKLRVIDRNDGKEWSEADLFDLRNSLEHGETIQEAAAHLGRSGTVDQVARKAEELGLVSRYRRRTKPETTVRPCVA